MTFDLSRAVKEGCRTRDGRSVRIICADLATRKQEDDLVIAIRQDDGAEVVYCCPQDGGAFDLVNLPQSHEVTVRMWQSGDQFRITAYVDGARVGFLNHDHTFGWEPFGDVQTIRIEEGEGL